MSRRTLTSPAKLFVGEVGDGIHLFGENYRDGATDIVFRSGSNKYAPAGIGGECLFRNLYVTVEALTAGDITVTPKVDGQLYDTVYISHSGDNPEAVTYEVPVTQSHTGFIEGTVGDLLLESGGQILLESAPLPLGDILLESGDSLLLESGDKLLLDDVASAGADGLLAVGASSIDEVSRAGVRGTWFEVILTGKDTEGNDWDVMVEGVELEYEIVRESLPHRSFVPDPMVGTDRSLLEILYVGESLGDGAWTMDLPGTGETGTTCPELSADGLICKETNGLFVGFDWGVGKDTFDLTKWISHWGSMPVHDAINGYVTATSGGAYYTGAPQQNRMWVAADVWYEGCAHYMPRLEAAINPLDLTTYVSVQQDWIITCTNSRMVACGVQGWGYSCILPVASPPDPGAWSWMSLYYRQEGATEHILGSGNDLNWSFRQFDSRIPGISGYPGLSSNRRLGGSTPSRFRKWRAYADGEITVKNIPTGYEVRIVRDAGEFGATTITHQNVSGGTVDIVSDAVGFPVPPNNKKANGPLTRIEVWIIAGAKQAEMTPAPQAPYDVGGVNWGDVYCYLCEYEVTALPPMSYLLEPNDVAPDGTGGECIFRNLYLPVTRANQTEVTCDLIPILDDVELTTIPLTLPALSTTEPVTEVHEIPLVRDYDDGSGSVSTYVMRGSRFRFRLEDADFPDGERLTFEGAEVEYEVVRETKAVQQITTGPVVPVVLGQGGGYATASYGYPIYVGGSGLPAGGLSGGYSTAPYGMPYYAGSAPSAGPPPVPPPPPPPPPEPPPPEPPPEPPPPPPPPPPEPPPPGPPPPPPPPPPVPGIVGPGPNEPPGMTQFAEMSFDSVAQVLAKRPEWDMLTPHTETSPVDGDQHTNFEIVHDPAFPNSPVIQNTWGDGFGDRTLWPGTAGRSGGTRLRKHQSNSGWQEAYISFLLRLDPAFSSGPVGYKVIGVMNGRNARQMLWVLITGSNHKWQLDQKIFKDDGQDLPAGSPRQVNAGGASAVFNTIQQIELYTKLCSGAGVADGIFTLWVAGVQRIHVTNIVNYTNLLGRASTADEIGGITLDPIPSTRNPSPENWLRYDDLYMSVK